MSRLSGGYTCFSVFGVLGQFGGAWPDFIILTYGALNLLSRMVSISFFGQAVQEILLNNCLKNSFEKSENFEL